MKSLQELENTASEASKKRLHHLRVVHEMLEEWCAQKLHNRANQLKSGLLFGAYIDACHHFAESYLANREALLNLHACIGNYGCPPTQPADGKPTLHAKTDQTVRSGRIELHSTSFNKRKAMDAHN